MIKRVTRLSCQLIIMPCPFPHRYDFGDVILREQQGPTQWPRIYYIYALSGTSTTSSWRLLITCLFPGAKHKRAAGSFTGYSRRT